MTAYESIKVHDLTKDLSTKMNLSENEDSWLMSVIEKIAQQTNRQVLAFCEDAGSNEQIQSFIKATVKRLTEKNGSLYDMANKKAWESLPKETKFKPWKPALLKYEWRAFRVQETFHAYARVYESIYNLS